MRKYRRGYTGRDFHVTGGHENQAKAAQRERAPTRIGLFVLRLLGVDNAAKPTVRVRRASPKHERHHTA